MNPVHEPEAVIPRQVLLGADAHAWLMHGGQLTVEHRPVVVDEDIPVVEVVFPAVLAEEENSPVAAWRDVLFKLT